jgi:hypothetical protein
MPGMMGSILAETATPLSDSFAIASRRSAGDGAPGSSLFQIDSLSDVMVMATQDLITERISASLATRCDLVTT